MPLLPSYTNQSTDLLVVRQKVKAFIRHFDTPKANQLTGFYLRATFAFNELTEKSFEGNENLCLKKSVIFPRNVTILQQCQRRIYGCWNIQGGVLCENSQRRPVVIYYHKALHLRCCSSPRSASECIP